MSQYLKSINDKGVKCLINKVTGVTIEDIEKPVNPLNIDTHEIDKRVINLLKQWSLVSYSKRSSLNCSLNNPITNPLFNPLWDSMRSLLWSQLRYSSKLIRNGPKQYAIEQGTKLDAIHDAVYFYIVSLLDSTIESYNYSQPLISLWNMGLIPSFDGGEIWRLHGGKSANVLFEISVDELKQDK